MNKKKIKEFIAFCIPGLLTFGFNCFCYVSPKFVVSPDQYIHLNTPWDDAIPLVPVFLIFYLGSYTQWALYYFQQNSLNNEETFRVFTGEIIGKLICWLCFIFFPVTINRPEITGGGFWNFMMRVVYFVDTPHCLFPSIHCFQSWMQLKFTIRHKDTKMIIITALFTLGVFASTVLVKQHLLLDIAGGLIVAEFGQFVSNHTNLYLKFQALCEKLRKRITG